MLLKSILFIIASNSTEIFGKNAHSLSEEKVHLCKKYFPLEILGILLVSLLKYKSFNYCASRPCQHYEIKTDFEQ